MHCDYWRLTHDPFRPHEVEHAWSPAGDHDEALSRMLYVVERGHRCGMVTGTEGSGKSRLLRELRRQVPKAATTLISVDLTGTTRSEFAATLVHACGCGVAPTAPAPAAWTALEDWLIGRAALHRRVVWLLDGIDAAAESVETDLLRLSRLAERSRVTGTLLLAVQRPGLLEQLTPFADFVVELTPWDGNESRQFVTQALVSAGGTESMLTEEAWDELIDAGQGNPRRLMRIAEVALLAGCAMEATELTGDLLSAVVHQLGWETTASHTMLAMH